MESIFKTYNRILGKINSAYHEAARMMELSDSELDILYLLRTHETGCLQSVLYKETCTTKSTVNSALRKMEREQLLYLTPGPGRNTRVFLTSQGEQLARETADRLIQLEQNIYRSWSEAEQEMFLRLNRDYADHLQASVHQLPKRPAQKGTAT